MSELRRTQIASVQFGRYRLVERLGAGGMGVVFRASINGPEGFSRSCVLKRIIPSLARDAGFVKALAGEARVSGLLHHPSIVQVHEFGQVDGEYFLAMEYVEGYSLINVLRRSAELRRPIEPALACYFIAEVAGALAYAHSLTDEHGQSLRIVHRDVSPSNIMLTTSGTVKLLDFGVAKAAGYLQQEETRTGTLKGKLSYLAPEQAEGGIAINRRVDIFALGIVLHECLTVRRLFRGADDLDTLRLVRRADIQPPSRYAAVPEDVDAVVMKMLARDREQRFASCQEVVRALTPIIRRLQGDAAGLRNLLTVLEPISLRNDTGGTPSLELGPTPGELTTSLVDLSDGTVTSSAGEIRIEDLRHRRASRWWLVGGGAAVLLAGLAVGWPGLLRHPTVANLGPIAAVTPATQPPAIAQPPVVSAPPSVAPAPPVPAALQTVSLKVQGGAGGEVVLEGRVLGRAPLELSLPRDDQRRTLVVRRVGYQPLSVGVTLSADVVVDASHMMARPPPTRKPTRAPLLKDPFAN